MLFRAISSVLGARSHGAGEIICGQLTSDKGLDQTVIVRMWHPLAIGAPPVGCGGCRRGSFTDEAGGCQNRHRLVVSLTETREVAPSAPGPRPPGTRPGCRIDGHAAVTLITPCRARDQSPTGVLQASQYRAGNPARSVPGPVRKPEKNIDGATPPCSTGLPVQTTQPIFPQPGQVSCIEYRSRRLTVVSSACSLSRTTARKERMFPRLRLLGALASH